ncbi:c-type cytochrome [Thiobacillus sp.]
MNRTTKTVLATLGVGALLAALAAFAVIYSGVFNVAATVEDAPPLRSVLVATREASIWRHARDIQTPPLGGAGQMERGFRIYREWCVMCHAPPGRPVPPMAKGLNPEAPAMVEEVEEMSPAELFWVTRNGIRFTGMPAWEASLSDTQIWDVVAFMRTLPRMTPADYDALERRFPPAPPKQR